MTIGKAVCQRLKEEKEILCVKDLKMWENKSDNEIKLLKVYGLSIQTLKNMILQYLQALRGSRPRPTVISHAEIPNPYESLYGSEWKQVILKTARMKRSILVNIHVKQIYENTKKVFSGTMYANNFYIYNDALSLMTPSLCKEYMTRKDIINHWVLPQKDINKRTKFSNRPVDNSLEVMPMDSNLNKDLHEGVNWLCCITNRPDNTDQRKFSKTVPKRMLSAYARAWDTSLLPEGYPSAKRIVQDVDCVVDEAYLRIFEAQGIVVPHLGTRRGRRNDRSIGQLPRGGKMIKKEEFHRKWIHPDARRAFVEKLEKVSSLHTVEL